MAPTTQVSPLEAIAEHDRSWPQWNLNLNDARVSSPYIMMLPGSIVCRIMCPYRVPESTAVITLVLSARGRESIAAKAHLALDGISIVLAGGCISTFTSAGDFTNLVCWLPVRRNLLTSH